MSALELPIIRTSNSPMTIVPSVQCFGSDGFRQNILTRTFSLCRYRKYYLDDFRSARRSVSERILRIGAGINPQNLLFCEIGNNLSYGFNPLEVQNPGDPFEESPNG